MQAVQSNDDNPGFALGAYREANSARPIDVVFLPQHCSIMASPNSLSTAYNSGLHRQPSARQLSRATVSRSGSRRTSNAIQGSMPRDHGISDSRRYSAGDSSDDEVPEPKFSASVKALLDEDGLGSSPRLQNGGGRQRTPNKPFSFTTGS